MSTNPRIQAKKACFTGKPPQPSPVACPSVVSAIIITIVALAAGGSNCSHVPLLLSETPNFIGVQQCALPRGMNHWSERSVTSHSSLPNTAVSVPGNDLLNLSDQPSF